MVPVRGPGTGVGGWSRCGTGHGQPGLGRARVGPGGRIGVALPGALPLTPWNGAGSPGAAYAKVAERAHQ